MKILFLTLVNISGFDEQHNIYADLCRELIKQGHIVKLVCPAEADGANPEYKVYNQNSGILKVKTGQVQKTNIIRKGISTLFIGHQFKRAIKRYFPDDKFDLVLYSTPPITLNTVVRFVKRRDKSVTYLLLKDIFPQNAVDLGMMSKTGLKSVIYKYFRYQEKKLYNISDYIGCMSPKNVKYLLENNPYINPETVHVSPNSFDSQLCRVSWQEKKEIRSRYNIPEDKTVFVYGGNIGEPQGYRFIIECLKSVAEVHDSFFVFCGNGTGFPDIERYVKESGQKNIKLIPFLPRNEYESFVGCCDIGLIFLDHRFTIPNFPSRILSYMQKCMPVIACTDTATDIGDAITEGNFGWWCESNDAKAFQRIVIEACKTDLTEMGENAGRYLKEHYTVENSVKIIMDNVNKNV